MLDAAWTGLPRAIDSIPRAAQNRRLVADELDGGPNAAVVCNREAFDIVPNLSRFPSTSLDFVSEQNGGVRPSHANSGSLILQGVAEGP